jgi:hypothetical protein
MLRDDAPEQVGGAAGAEGHDVLDWLVGIVLLCRGCADDSGADHQRETNVRGELHDGTITPVFKGMPGWIPGQARDDNTQARDDNTQARDDITEARDDIPTGRC